MTRLPMPGYDLAELNALLANAPLTSTETVRRIPGAVQYEQATTELVTREQVAVRIVAMSEILRLLTSLLTDDWGYGEDNLPPTNAAFQATWVLLSEAANLTAASLPRPDLGPLGDGGLSMQWGDKSRYVRLLMPPDPSKAYLYSKGVEEKRSEPATPEVLARRLAWLNQG